MSPHEIWNDCFQCGRTLKLSSDRAKANAKAKFFDIYRLLFDFIACRLIVFRFQSRFPSMWTGPYTEHIMGMGRCLVSSITSSALYSTYKDFPAHEHEEARKVFRLQNVWIQCDRQTYGFCFSMGFVVLCCCVVFYMKINYRHKLYPDLHRSTSQGVCVHHRQNLTVKKRQATKMSAKMQTANTVSFLRLHFNLSIRTRSPKFNLTDEELTCQTYVHHIASSQNW